MPRDPDFVYPQVTPQEGDELALDLLLTSESVTKKRIGAMMADCQEQLARRFEAEMDTAFRMFGNEAQAIAVAQQVMGKTRKELETAVQDFISLQERERRERDETIVQWVKSKILPEDNGQ